MDLYAGIMSVSKRVINTLAPFKRAVLRCRSFALCRYEVNMNIVEKRLDELQPYENNPRKNDNAVPYVAKSIEKYGFKNPIIIDKNGVIVAGHTRYLASIELGLDKVPCIIADDLTEEQIKEFRLVDNKTSEFAGWDFDMLADELQELDFDFDFQFPEVSDVDIDSMFVEHDLAPKEPKTITCPNCGEEIEI